MKKMLSLVAAIATAALLTACGKTETTDTSSANASANTTITVYSARKEHLIKPLFDAYTAKTGINIQYITDKAGPLLSRLKSEGVTTKADILLTTDVGNLWQAQKQGVLQQVKSKVLDQQIPEHLRDKDHYWFGLTQRSRTIVYSTERLQPEQLSTYAALSDESFKGRLCLRTSKKVYNQSLVASMVAHQGADKTTTIVKGWVANLAVAPFSNDTAAMQAVQAGQCDATIVNTYYFGRLEKDGKAEGLKIFWPDQDQGQNGVHMNISGAGVTAHAKHTDAAIKLLEWLSGPEAQEMLAGLNMEFPVNPQVKSVAQVQAWGAFKADSIPLNEIAAQQIEAVKIIDSAGYL
ncbi:MAG: extracellular solute-binding protein [Pseudomonadales bacterium]|nr:extracellular solute-binding protein [Pseudomonadales bacterium]